MKLPREKVYPLLILASLFFSLATVTFGFFPHLGMSAGLFVFLTLAFLIRNERSTQTNIFFAISTILSLMLAVRSEGFLTFLNFWGVVFFGSLMLLGKKDKDGIISTITAPIEVALGSLMTKSIYKLELTKTSEKKETKLVGTVIPILLTILVIGSVVPLLASSNPFFRKIVDDFISIFNISIPQITQNLFEWLIRLIVFLTLALIIPKIATYTNDKKPFPFKLEIPSLNLLLPKVVIAFIIFIFFITQIQLYFSSATTLAELGYTYSQYAREVFAQLSAVAAIIFLLLYNDGFRKRANKTLTYILSVSAIFLVFMAYKSVYEYTSAWGLTYKRLYGFTVATWIFGIFIIFLNDYLANKGSDLIKRLLVFSGIILILVNIFNFDYLIYHFKKSTTGAGIDHNYLSRLSSDSLSYKKQLNDLENRYPGELTLAEKQMASNEGATSLIFKIENLQEKYNKLDIRQFNLYEYLQYKDIQDVHIGSLRQKYISQYPLQPAAY